MSRGVRHDGIMESRDRGTKSAGGWQSRLARRWRFQKNTRIL